MIGKCLVVISIILVSGQEMAVAQPSRSDIIQERRQNFKAMGAAFKGLNDQLRRPAADSAVIRQQAARLSAASDRFAAQNWFPKGSGPESGRKTEASPAIWTKSRDFAGMRSALKAQTRQLSAAAATEDTNRIRLAVKAVGQSCAACHKHFRNDD